ncbi:MAG: glycosyl transferase family 1, partial [Muribaculaceae bacterium]|nr:glycosyl transferase family 1 [Muribaculaceae bacterium]
MCRLSALGDVAMTIPVIYSAARENPDTRFVMLTSKRIKEIFINTPANLEVIGIKKDKYKGLGGTIRLFREVRKQVGFNAFADLHSVIRTHLFGAICRLRGIKTARIDKGRNEKRALTRHAAKAVKQLKSGL